ncbi:MAG TPA: hypothetical protein VIT91_05910 [Chthoniobacterales bacterium]
MIDRLNKAGIPYALVGSFSSNFWGIPRSTKDVDFVLQLAGTEVNRLWEVFQPDFAVDDQLTFETMTGSQKLEVRHPQTVFKIELFLLSSDPHHQARFTRRKLIHVLGRNVWMPTPEDVVIQKLRWARTKDLDDATNVLAVQGGTLDFEYIRHWCGQHGTLGRLDAILVSLPKI